MILLITFAGWVWYPDSFNLNQHSVLNYSHFLVTYCSYCCELSLDLAIHGTSSGKGLKYWLHNLNHIIEPGKIEENWYHLELKEISYHTRKISHTRVVNSSDLQLSFQTTALLQINNELFSIRGTKQD
jgi:hypothetical protein